MAVSTTGVVAFACVILVIILFVASRRKEGRAKTTIDRVAPELGLFPVGAVEPLLVDRIKHRYRRTDTDVDVGKVFSGVKGDCRIHLFDLLSRAKDPESPVIVNTVVSISSPRLHLSRFSIQPRMNLQGKLGTALSNALNRRIISSPPEGLTRLEVEFQPEFDRQYVLFAAEPALVMKRLTNQVLAYLAGTEWYAIEAEDDMLTVANMLFDAERLGGRIAGEKIKRLVQDAERLCELFIASAFARGFPVRHDLGGQDAATGRI